LAADHAQATQLLHRGREQSVRQRTMLVNPLRAHLAEFGLVAAQGLRNVGELIAIVRDRDDRRVPNMAREILQVLANQIEQIETAIAALERQLLAWHKTNAVSQRLACIPGIGRIIATAIATTVADPKVFRSGRECAAWLGLVPRQNSTRGENPTGGNHETRQPLSAAAAHQWGKRQVAAIEGHESRPMGDRAASATTAARRRRCAGEQDRAYRLGCRCAGEQDGAYRLGCDAARQTIPTPGSGGLMRRGRRGSLRESIDV
jgi:Transposase IS116/IS110/IS902 family